MRSWKRGFLMFVVVFVGVLTVTDVQAQLLPWRRRRLNNRFYTGTTYTYGARTGATYGAAPAMGMPRAEVAAPGVGVATGPGGASVAAPGVGVDAAPRAGVRVDAPGANIGAGAGVRTGTGAGAAGANIRGGTDADIRVRGQTPDQNPPPRDSAPPRDAAPPLPPPAP